MSGKVKHPRAKAVAVARELTVALRGLCEPGRFIFAGSLRRLKPEVGDIEVVYVPLVESRPDPDDLLPENRHRLRLHPPRAVTEHVAPEPGHDGARPFPHAVHHVAHSEHDLPELPEAVR